MDIANTYKKKKPPIRQKPQSVKKASNPKDNTPNWKLQNAL